MTQIDTSKWGKFRVGDLFETFHGERLKKSDRIEGSTPFVTAGSENQGVADYIVTEKKYFNAITINVFGNCFYHDGTLFGDDNIYFLISNNISEYSKLFITTIINSTLKEKYSFFHQFRQKDLDTLAINLPSTPDNFPDWQFMEDYMKEITKLATKRVEKLKEEKTQTKIDTSNWKKFKVGELFDVANGKKYPSSIRQTGELPLISTTANNNGISDYIKDRNDGVYSNCITVAYSGSVGATFYHKEKVFVGETVIALLPKFKMNQYSGLFICSILSKINSKFSYTQKIKVLQYKNEAISLPVTPEGTPDFDYMENYMKEITEKAKKKFSNIPQ